MTPPDLSTLKVAADGPVGRLTLARPERLNALGRTTLRELAVASRWLDGQAAVKVVVVTGEGRSFCAGFDLDELSRPDPGVSSRDAADLGRSMAEAVTAVRAVTVVAVQGWCVGGGLVLAAACDLRVAADDARFAIPEVDLGIPLAWGGIPRLVREIGPAMTKELVMTCRPFGAAEARELGFLNRVVPADRLTASTEELAQSLATRSALTLRITKQQVNAAAEDLTTTAHAGTDADLLAAVTADADSRAAAAGYLAGRAARAGRAAGGR